MNTTLPGAYFTIEIDGRPTIVFYAERLAMARELAHEQWLRDDLSQLKSIGEAVCRPSSKLTARSATADEIATFLRDVRATEPTGEQNVISYLVELDDLPKTCNN